MASRYVHFSTYSAVARQDTAVIPERRNHQVLLRHVVAKGGHANDFLKVFPAKAYGETTVLTGIAGAATAIYLVGDGATNTLHGVAVAANDYVLIMTDTKGWQLALVGAVTASDANKIRISTLTALDGGAGAKDAITAGNKAFVIWAEDILSVALGTAQFDLEYMAAGEVGKPLALSSLGADTAAHFMGGVCEYVAC